MSQILPAPHTLDQDAFPCRPPFLQGDHVINLNHTTLGDVNQEAVLSAIVTLCARKGAWVALPGYEVAQLLKRFPKADNPGTALGDMGNENLIVHYKVHTERGPIQYIDPTPRLAQIYMEADVQL